MNPGKLSKNFSESLIRYNTTLQQLNLRYTADRFKYSFIYSELTQSVLQNPEKELLQPLLYLLIAVNIGKDTEGPNHLEGDFGS